MTWGKRLRWKDARIVFRKEILETVRDTRTLIFMVVVPVLLYPALLIASEQLTLFGRRQLERDPSPVAVVGDVDPELDGFLRERDDLILRDIGSPEDAVRSDSVTAVAVLEAGGGVGETQRVTLIFDAADDRSRRGREVLGQAFLAWRDTLLERRLVERGLPEGFARPMVVADSSVARPEELGGYALGRFLPMLLVVITLLGAFYPAIDLAAGEKERGTLETLLTAPVPPGQIVAGKFLTVMVVGLVAAALNLASMLLTFQTGLFQLTLSMEIEFSLPFGSILVIFATLVPLAVLFGALFLGIAVRSRSFKEAQNALTPVYMAVLLPALLPLFPGIDFTPGLALVPVAGVALFFRELMSGNEVFLLGSIALLSTLVYASAALIFAADSFGREEVLFGDGGERGEVGEGHGFLSGLRHAEPVHDRPRLGTTLAFLAVVGVLYFFMGVRAQVWFGEDGIVISEVGFLLLPALLLLRVGAYDPVKTLFLRLPRGRHLLAAVLIIAGGTPLVWLLTWLQSLVLPLPWEFMEGMSDFLAAESRSRVVWLLVLVALTPAICEEALFRGVVLSGTMSRLTPGRLIVLNGLLFGAFHVPSATIFRFLPSAALGMLLAWVVLRSRSIWTGVVMHFLNNGSIVILATSPWILERFSDPERSPPFWLLGLACLSLGAGAVLLEGGRGDKGREA